MVLNRQKKKNILGVLFFYVSIFPLFSAQYEFNFTEKAELVKDKIMKLELDEADSLLVLYSKSNTENIAWDWLKESSLFLRLFISEEAAAYKSHKKEWDKLIDQTENKKFSNAWYGFVLSEMYIHRALIRLKFSENLSAGNDIHSAFKILKTNHSKYPFFLADNKNLGFLYCLFSSVPSKYNWLVKIVGMEGDMEKGIGLLEDFIKSSLRDKEYKSIRLETAFTYAIVQHHLNQNTEKAWSAIDPETKSYKSIVLQNYMRALVAGYAGKNDEVVNVLKDKPLHVKNSEFYYMDYMLGQAKLRKLDKDADIYLLRFVLRFKGKNYIKSAYRYLAWYAQIFETTDKAKSYYSLCTKNGVKELELDKVAENDAHAAIIWEKELLKSRLLFDGHYLQLSLEHLNTLKASDCKTVRSKLELHYRKGRLNQALGDDTEAIASFKKTIEEGRNEVYYYAAYSSLQMAFIYEKRGDKVNAKKYFKMAKDEFKNNTEFVPKIEQLAKAGLKRIGK